jgi:hypothetical protein
VTVECPVDGCWDDQCPVHSVYAAEVFDVEEALCKATSKFIKAHPLLLDSIFSTDPLVNILKNKKD